jgi:quercetin dioxygenase-like cupin family protein
MSSVKRGGIESIMREYVRIAGAVGSVFLPIGAPASRSQTLPSAQGKKCEITQSKGAVMQQDTTRVNASEETIQIGRIGVRFLLTGDDSNGSVSVFEFSVPAGEKLAAPAHKNDAYEEVLYGIEGLLTWTLDGTPIEVGPGQALCIPRGAVHRFDNLGSEDVKQLAVITPAIIGPAYFREAAEVIAAAAGGPPDRAKMSEVFRRHCMTVAPPPPAK